MRVHGAGSKKNARGRSEGIQDRREREKRRGYFLCRARFNSFRCLCFRIFLRRFLITLPTGYLRAPRLQRRSVRMESFRRPERSRRSE
jgi:hypothetical protein